MSWIGWVIMLTYWFGVGASWRRMARRAGDIAMQGRAGTIRQYEARYSGQTYGREYAAQCLAEHGLRVDLIVTPRDRARFARGGFYRAVAWPVSVPFVLMAATVRTSDEIQQAQRERADKAEAELKEAEKVIAQWERENR